MPPKKALDKGRSKSVMFRALYMKKSPLTTVLLGVLVLSAAISLVLCWQYMSYVRELRTMRGKADRINQVAQMRPLTGNLIHDAQEYAKTHKNIEPVLDYFGVRTNVAATTNKNLK
jgi:hypothetical protein